jgi:hypothetical protein
MGRMGLFQNRPEEQENQWKLPSEPFERTESDLLDVAPPVDPLALGLGAGVTSITFPLTGSADD